MENKTSSSQLRATEKYLHTKVDSFSFRVPKGGKKIISAVADYYGVAVNQYLCIAARLQLVENSGVIDELIKDVHFSQEEYDRLMTALYYDIYDSYK